MTENVREALDAVAVRHALEPMSTPSRFPTIAREISTRLKRLQPEIECYYNSGMAAECDGPEWNSLDFLALARDLSLPEEGWRPMQAIVVGEVEWSVKSDEIDYDFEKVLIVDTLLFFMVFQQFALDDANVKLSHLERKSRQRQDYAQFRGNKLPAFLLSCWVDNEHHFEHQAG